MRGRTLAHVGVRELLWFLPVWSIAFWIFRENKLMTII